MLGQSGIPAVFISGKSGMKKRKQTIDNMRSGKAQLVIASTIADVGLDVPRLQSIVEAGAGKSSVTALQRLGRIMRPFDGKDKCYFITYQDNAPYLSSQIDKKIEIWSTEKEFVIDKR
jgi:superfamily II DNA or RNA helicase